jgi:hypothetical protein
MNPRTKRILKLILVGLVLLVGFFSVAYLMPHKIERDLPIVDARLLTYASWGRITHEEVVDLQGNVLELREFNTWRVPLYRYRETGRMVAEKTFYFDDPSKPHWSTCVTYIDDETMVVQEDPDQDGVVDECECKPAEWGI